MPDNLPRIIPANRTERTRAALIEALNDFGTKIREHARQHPLDGNALKALSMFAGVAPVCKMMIGKLSDKDADGIVELLERFLERVKAE